MTYTHDLSNPFIKSISINDLPEGAWQYITGKSADVVDMEKYYQSVPWLFRGVDIRANGVASMPFAIYKGDQEVDNSDDYRNVVGFLPRPFALFGLLEAALTIFGNAYAFKARNPYLTKSVRYLLTSSIICKINDETGEIKFTRTVGGKPANYTPDDIMYFWGRDAFVEYGPANASPAKSAAAAAGVLLNVDEFASAFFARGAIKVTLLTTTNILPAERSRLKDWWARLTGVGKAWQTDIVNAETVKPVVIGEGLESLQDNNLTAAKREDIAAGLGIPYSILWSGSASGMGGGGVAAQDRLNLYNDTIIPDCKNILQAEINTQLLEPLGYRLAFTPENLDVFQEDENARAQSLSSLIAALEDPERFLLASDILGYEINPDTRTKIEGMVAEKEKRREEMAEMTASRPPVPPIGQPPVTANNEPDDERQNMRAADMKRWQTKAINRMRSKEPMAFPFTSKHIDPVTLAAVGAQLEEAETEEQVKAVFMDAWVGYP